MKASPKLTPLNRARVFKAHDDQSPASAVLHISMHSQKTRSEDHQQYPEHLKESSQVEFRTQL